jgi:uncharacterized protein YfaS (alpha-2-macroglobulin family)
MNSTRQYMRKAFAFKKPQVFFLALVLMIIIPMLAFQSPQKNDMTQNDPYPKEWKIIDSLESQGLPRSALDKVETLYARAKREQQHAQVIKTILYKSKYNIQLTEEGLAGSIRLLESELAQSEYPLKPILHSLIAEAYQQYVSQNYWQLRDRTNTPGYKAEKLEDWSLEQLLESSSANYIASVEDEKTSSLSIVDYTAITLGGDENSDQLRPTVYDFLAHRAIDHFMNESTYLTQPANRFRITDPSAFAGVQQFVNAKFETPDEESYQFKTLQLFQSLLKKRLEDRNKAALLDADLKRLKYVRNKSTLPHKDILYYNTLKGLESEYANTAELAEIWYYQADYLQSLGNTYQAGDNTHKWKLKEAVELCDKAIETYPESYGAKLGQNLKKNLKKVSLDVEVESVNLPNKPILTSASYRNLKLAYFRLIKLNEDQIFEFRNQRSEEVHERLLKMPAARSWKVTLPDDGDLQQHRVELAIEPLSYGSYALMIGGDEQFTLSNKATGYLFTTVSNLAYLSRRTPKGQVEMVVVDRNTGMPLSGVKAEYYEQKYNRRDRTYERNKIGEQNTDKNGFVRPNVNTKKYFQVRFSKGNDVLYFTDGYSNRQQSDFRKKELITHFFLDRSIYRPGQPIYFKAIVLENDKERKPTIVPNRPFTVTFYDVNRQEVSKLELRTNEYGTANGVFTAPQNGLLGMMSFESDAGNSHHTFSIEEYKRPKFEVTFHPLEGSPALEETVKISGEAKAFAGSSIDGAQVNYRVVREVQFPWWPWWRSYRPYYPSGQSQEIASGTTTTDAKGKFELSFLAQADPSLSAKDRPEFIYTIMADVVDITGETRSSTKQVRLAYLGLKTDIDLPEAVALSDANVIANLIVQNLDGEKQNARGTLSINRLVSPQKLYINRYWPEPDQYVLDEIAFGSQFAHYAYKGADKQHNWKVAETILQQQFDTGEEQTININMSGLKVGHYKVNMKVKDANGNDIESTKFFMIYDDEKGLLPSGTLTWQKPDNNSSYSPGETVNMLLASSDNQLNVLYELQRKQEIDKQEWLLGTNWNTISYKVSEEDRGNVFTHFSAVKFNRAFLFNETIRVPWKNKELEIQYRTFRDKLSPGQEETWEIVIKGQENEKIAAEMVAAMYDASLDQFRPHNWRFSPHPYNYSRIRWRAPHFNANRTTEFYYGYFDNTIQARTYRYLNSFGALADFYPGYAEQTLGAAPGRGKNVRALAYSSVPDAAVAEEEGIEVRGSRVNSTDYYIDGLQGKAAGISSDDSSGLESETNQLGATGDAKGPIVRTNLKETVFFYPDLRTDAEGNVIVKFTMNEALTKWKFLGLAHTKDLQIGLTENEVVTQKELMVLPNPPRFFREGDQITYTAKVSNLTQKAMRGQARLELFNALTMEPIDVLLNNNNSKKTFLAEAGQSAALSWELTIPEGEVMAVTHRVVAESGNFADGEEAALPVLTNRTLVTETMPLALKGKETKTFSFKAMDKAKQSNTLKHHDFTLEFTSNPAWYAVKALPYLMDYPYECTEQIFSRYYANALASSIATSNPKIERVFEQWRNTDALVSELAKNEELKAVLLEETPWVLQAQSETEQRKRIGLLFDLNRMGHEEERTLAQLDKRQAGNGGFSWFPGGRENWYITQYILEGFGRLRALGVKDMETDQKSWNIITKAVQFVDEEMVASYKDLLRRAEKGYTNLEDDHLSHLAIHYLYTRSLFEEIPVKGTAKEATNYYLGQAEQYWIKKGRYQQGLLALALNNNDNIQTAGSIVNSLRERALYHEELGMYWKADYGYYWYQLPVETHSLMIEVFAEVADDADAVEQLKVWLLKNKQTTHWKTTKATAGAVYALLHYGDNWLEATELAEVSFPIASSTAYEEKIAEAKKGAEAGTGYFKTSWKGDEVSTSFSAIQVTNPNESIAWGAAYWQYFEDLDKVDIFEDTPLKLSKKLFREVNGDKGPELVAITDDQPLEPGDKLVVRITLEVDRNMEYVHLKDHRASGLEPINVLSRYKWQGGLGYYESTKDAATHFFMDYLPKGKYVFEYPLRVVHKGDFSNGMASIQCMYAPEFTSHSQGQRITVK